MKHVIAAAILAVAAVPAWQAGVAADGTGEHSEQTVIQSRTFTIPAGQCPQLPAHVEVKGLGVERTTTTIEGPGDNDDRGKSGVRGDLVSRISGTATDNVGGTYSFSYELRLKKPIPIPGTATVIDRFRLTGTGVANGLATFFRATTAFDSGFNPRFETFQIIEQSGDPFLCDPL
jgi:hypothetical protein